MGQLYELQNGVEDCTSVSILSRSTNPYAENTWKLPMFDYDSMKTKEVITKVPLLLYNNPHKPPKVQIDSNKDALGASVLQDGHPIEFASKKLTDTEKQWAR